jgi:3-hydroxyacyl-CoA dehydrogenase
LKLAEWLGRKTGRGFYSLKEIKLNQIDPEMLTGADHKSYYYSRPFASDAYQ